MVHGPDHRQADMFQLLLPELSQKKFYFNFFYSDFVAHISGMSNKVWKGLRSFSVYCFTAIY